MFLKHRIELFLRTLHATKPKLLANILYVPFRIRALHLEQETPVASASVDFSKLPYYDSEIGQLVNDDSPFTSENVLTKPFLDDLHPLAKGNHLHFILPSPFTHFHDDGKNLPVPNKWLIRKGELSWVVESDFLSKKSIKDGNQITTLAPIDKDEVLKKGYGIDQKGNFQPFRYMGRQITIDQWRDKEDHDEYWKDMYQSPLTAFAYGDPDFPSNYPNCKSVFGFHDTNADASDAYEVFGWYDYDSEEEINGINQSLLFEIQSVIKTVDTNKSFTDELQKRISFFTSVESKGWNLGTSEENELGCSWDEIKNSINNITSIQFYSASMETLKTPTSELKNDIKFALGNNGPEALSAFIAAETYPDDPIKKIELEDKLEAIQFEELKTIKNDLGAKFEEARHEKGFKTVSSGLTWGYSYHDKNGEEELSKEQSKIIDVFEIEQDHLNTLIFTLSLLNRNQANYDQNVATITSKQHQLFSDWYTFIFSAHPPMLFQGDFLESDEVLAFINDHVIPDLDELMFSTGRLIIQKKSAKTTFPSFVSIPDKDEDKIMAAAAFLEGADFMKSKGDANVFSENSLANQFLETLIVIEAELRELNDFARLKDAGILICLENKPSPRYYQPTDPVLLISGDVIPNEVHKEPTVLRNYYSKDVETSLLNVMHDKSALMSTAPPEAFTIAPKESMETVNFSWHPNRMEWETTFYPLDNTSVNSGYHKDYLANVFDLPSGKPNFVPTHDETNKDLIDTTQAVSVYKGFSNLSSHALSYLSDQLEPYMKGGVDIELKDAFNQIQNQNISVLSQSFQGFNEAFIMQKQSLQIASILDPVAFDDYKEYIRDIDTYINNVSATSPIPSSDFNPIRMGGLNISTLNLIDTFGQKLCVYNVDEDESTKVYAAKTMSVPTNTSWKNALNFDKHHAFLYPRYIQPSKLNVRWLNKNSDDEECGRHAMETPICGWVVHNVMDDNLMFYNTEGELLGSVGLINDTPGFIQKPESTLQNISGLITSEIIENNHLRNFTNHILRNDKAFFDNLLLVLTHAQEHTDPESFEQHPELSLLIGQPMALVRAKLDFKLFGEYARNQRGKDFQIEMFNSQNNTDYKYSDASFTDNFEKVEIPIRLGDYRQLNDGLIGYWDDSDNSTEDVKGIFHTPIGDLYTGSHVSIKSVLNPLEIISLKSFLVEHIKMEISQAPADDPHYLTMLFDPRAQLNITTGVLPVKTIDIPSGLYKHALKNIRATFLMSPIITPKDKLQFPLPKAGENQWKWIYFDNKKPIKIPTAATISKSVLNENWDALKTDVYDVWDKLIQPNDLTDPLDSNYPLVEFLYPSLNGITAYIHFNLITPENLKELLNISKGKSVKLTPLLMQVLLNNHLGIDTAQTDANYGPNEIREGWLELSEAPEIKPKTH